MRDALWVLPTNTKPDEDNGVDGIYEALNPIHFHDKLNVFVKMRASVVRALSPSI